MEDQDYYQYQKKWERLFIFLSMAVRKNLHDLFMREMQPDRWTTILDVGVTSDARLDSNFFEKYYPYPNRITCSGLDRDLGFTQAFPACHYVQIGPEGLPFQDNAFGIGVSFAVVEHVGSSARQRHYISEILRVCKKVFITTPNFRFPIEPHTMLPFLHYLPNTMWRKSLYYLGRKFYASEERLNPLNAERLQALFPKHAHVKIKKIGTAGLSTNLAAIAS